jgi:radical SAM protein with 4Fe4S-binding SPASM domain
MERLAAEWGVPLQVNANIAPRDDLEPGAWGARVALPDLVRLRRRRGVPPPHDVPEDRSDLRCVMGRRLVAINAYGDVFPCIMVPIPAGNVRYAPLDEIWRTSPFLRFVREFRHVERAHTCGGCGYRGDCFRCPGLAYMETGDLFGPSPSACLEAVATRQARNSAGLDAADLPPGLVHADSRLWSVHDILRTAGLACVETHLEEATAGGVR